MSGSLGDSLSANTKLNLAQKSIIPGSVIFCYSDAAGKDKICVIIGINQDKSTVAVILFNTKKPFLGNKILEPLQVHFKAENNTFLDHDSYLNCAHIELVAYKFLVEDIAINPDHLFGSMSQSNLDRVCSVAANAKTASPKRIKIYGLSGYLFQSNK